MRRWRRFLILHIMSPWACCAIFCVSPVEVYLAPHYALGRHKCSSLRRCSFRLKQVALRQLAPLLHNSSFSHKILLRNFLREPCESVPRSTLCRFWRHKCSSLHLFAALISCVRACSVLFACSWRDFCFLKIMFSLRHTMASTEHSHENLGKSCLRFSVNLRAFSRAE